MYLQIQIMHLTYNPLNYVTMYFEFAFCKFTIKEHLRVLFEFHYCGKDPNAPTLKVCVI